MVHNICNDKTAISQVPELQLDHGLAHWMRVYEFPFESQKRFSVRTGGEESGLPKRGRKLKNTRFSYFQSSINQV